MVYITLELYSDAVLFLIGSIGNGLIISYFLKINAKGFRKMIPYHFLLTYLAVVDFLVSIGNTLLYFTWKDLRLNKFNCKYTFILLKMSLPSYSIYILVMISYERYCKMVFPFKQPIRKKILLVVLLSIMVFCTGFYVPLMRSNRIINNKCYMFKTIVSSNTSITAYYISMVCLDCLIPSVVIVWLYYKISVTFECVHNNSNRPDQNQQLQNYKRKKAALKTLRALTIMYVLFVFPGRFFVLGHELIYTNANSFYQRHADAFILTARLMEISLYVNNIGNVFVYAWLIVGFRQLLKNILTFGLLNRQSNTIQNTT